MTGAKRPKTSLSPSVRSPVMSYEYPLARPLFVYAKNESLENNESFMQFMEFTLNNASSAAEEAGYVPLTEDEMQEQKDKLEAFK